MKLEWKSPGSADHELVWGLLGLLVLLFGVLVPVDAILASIGYECGFRRATGVPCMFCGATRAFVAAGHLRAGQAFATNPLSAALFYGLAAFVPYALGTVVLRSRRIRISDVPPREKRLFLASVVLLLLANWAYLLLAPA